MIACARERIACARIAVIACARKLAQGPLVARHLSKNSKLYSIDHLIIFQRAIFGLNSEMKSRKEINKQNYQRKRDYIKAQRKLYYSPAQRKLAYIQQKSASAQKVRNEQFCNHRSATSATNQAGIKLPIEIRESLTHASKCDQKSMQVEGKWCLPVCLICNKVIINCETMQTLDKKIVIPQKQRTVDCRIHSVRDDMVLLSRAGLRLRCLIRSPTTL